jgi:hypothetical protein
MRPLLKLYLLLSSLLFLVIVSCRISKYKHSNCDKVILTEQLLKPILSNKQPLKFKATIDVLKNHLTGILIVKQTDSVATHLVFVTELGMKMFDFVYKDNRMEAVYVFEPLNKPKLIQSLMRNFENMFLFKIINHSASYCKTINGANFYYLNEVPRELKSVFFSSDSLNHLIKQDIFNRRKQSALINYSYNSNTESYNQIKCLQYGLVKIHIELNEIPKTND